MTTSPETLFWELAAELQRDDPRIVESTIMNGRCLRVGKELLALVDYKGSGLVVKLPGARVAELVASSRRSGTTGGDAAGWTSCCGTRRSAGSRA